MSVLDPSSSASLEGFLSKDWAITLKTNNTTLVIIGILFGFQVAAYIVSMHVLVYAGQIPPCLIVSNLGYLSSQRGLKGSNARCVLALVSSFMILCSGIVLGALVSESQAQIQLLTIQQSTRFSLGQPVSAVMATVASSLIFLLNDALIIWRAWILVGHIHQVVLGFCFVGTLASMILFNIEAITEGTQASATNGILFGIPLLATNLVATSIIAWKLWCYRQTVKAYIRRFTPDRSSMGAEKALILLVESGLINLLFWIFAQIAMQGSFNGSEIVSNIISFASIFVIALQPLLVILLVAKQQSALDVIHRNFTMSISLQCASSPGNATSNRSDTNGLIGARERDMAAAVV